MVNCEYSVVWQSSSTHSLYVIETLFCLTVIHIFPLPPALATTILLSASESLTVLHISCNGIMQYQMTR